MDPVNNPQLVQNSRNEYYKPTGNNLFGTRSSRIVYIDSRLRDVEREPSANNFTVNIRPGFVNVVSVELLSMCIPNMNANHPDGPVTTEPVILLKSPQLGYIEMAKSLVNPATSCPAPPFVDPCLIGRVGTVFTQPVDLSTYPSVGGGPRHLSNNLGDDGFAKIYSKVDATVSGVDYIHFIPRSDMRVIKYFRPQRVSLHELNFSLFTWGPAAAPVSTTVPYPLPNEVAVAVTANSGLLPHRNVQICLEVVCQG